MYGAIIYSDCWIAYVNNRISKSLHLTQFGYIHFYMDHSIQFVSSFSNFIHINTVERLWRTINRFVRIFNKKVFINEYLAKTYLNLTMDKDQQFKLLWAICAIYN